MMDRGVRTFEQMTADGVIREVQDATAMTLFLMSAEFGVLLLREHVKRHLAFDPFSPEGIARWLGAEMDLLHGGLLAGDATPTTTTSDKSTSEGDPA